MRRLTLSLTAKARATVLTHTRAVAPEEACGLLFGSRSRAGLRIDRVAMVRNVSPHPATSFTLDPLALLRHLDDPALLGVVHSHPVGALTFSAADRTSAHNWPCLVWMLVLPGDALLAATPHAAGWAFHKVQVEAADEPAAAKEVEAADEPAAADEAEEPCVVSSARP